jgi:putative endonuclease
MYYVYIIKSQQKNYKYIGYTSDLINRVKEHNFGKTKSIKHLTPFELIYYEAYTDKTLARKREIQLKNKSYLKEELFKRVE